MKWTGVVIGLLAARAVFAETAYVDFEHELIYPQKLGGMEFSRHMQFDNADFGYALLYTHGTFRCEVQVLTMGRSDIPDGPKGDGIELVFQSLEKEMEHEVKAGQIAGLKKRGGLLVPKKSPLQFANTVFQYSEPREVEGIQTAVPRINSVYVTGSHDRFFKVQFHFDVAENKRARMMADELVKQLVLALIAKPTEEEILLAACDAAINNPGDYSGQIAAQHVFTRCQTMDGLNIYDGFFVWPQEGYNKPKNADFLTTAYFAGMLKTIVPLNQEQGGEFEAFSAMLQAYENMRTRDQIEEIPKLAEWAKDPDRKGLYQNLLVEFGYVAGN